jgi:hypothetical protein
MDTIVAQVAAEAIINDDQAFDLDTIRIVHAAALAHNVGALYVGMLTDIIAARENNA